MTSPESRPVAHRLDFLPWEYAGGASEAERARQAERQTELTGSVELAPDVYVAESAAVFCDVLRLGERSYVGAHAYLTGEVLVGANSTINPFAVVRGRITLGDGVRIGAHSSLLAFNHGTAPDQPIYQQPHTSLGIVVGDDVWIGSNALILDGVTVGSHSIIGAGAVVTKDVDEWAVVAGNPARKLRDRREKKPTTDLSVRAAEFARVARRQADELLARCFDGEQFVDRPGLGNDLVRPWCDAIEISDLLLRRTPSGHSADDLARRLRAAELSVLDGPGSYHILCAGYALQLLDSSFEQPIPLDLTAAQYEALPWARNAWSAGSAIDSVGTAIAWNLKHHSDSTHLFELFGWLTARADPKTGMWGQPHPDDGWLQVVNGFYRLTRGTYAQYGLPLPYPEAAIRTVLTHAQDQRLFTGDGYNACNVLDVIHPLWLAGKQTDVGRAEGRRWAEHMLDSILGRWVDGAGFAFAPDGTDDRAIPGLQGTEMWLAIIWLLTDYLGFSDVLGYRPRGVHRPEPLIAVPNALT
jgi:carbonic anhydrase/acetyltransferase-like protein (isoleucine patch superfamily)